MANYCSKQERCSYDVYEKLKNSDLKSEEIQNIIKYLKDNNFINHQRYALAYANDKFRFNKWGKIKIKNMLKAKKIEENFILSAISEIDTNEYLKNLKNILLQKSKNIKDTDPYKRKAKLINHAVSKGYELDLIYMILDNEHLTG